ncbi:MAG TPA: hypothetical protein VJ814_05450 [Gaiellaceae bacterium]|nr:hypothetical protein [Gaiellaceae bacterium]
MVALIVEAARAAREEAQRLRSDSVELRLVLHRRSQLADARTREAAAVAAAAARVKRERALPSPWSELLWRREDQALDQVLFPVD